MRPQLPRTTSTPHRLLSATDATAPAPSDEAVKWARGDELEGEPGAGEDLPDAGEMFEPKTPAAEGSDEEARAGLQRPVQNMEQLLVTMDGLAANGTD